MTPSNGQREMSKRRRPPKRVRTLTHDDASRKNIPTAEYQPVLPEGDRTPIQVAYKRRSRDLDPQLVWRGKDVQDWSDLVVPAPPLFIQEKVHPKVLIDDLVRQSRESGAEGNDQNPDLFADFNGLPEGEAKTEFYEHDAKWSNRMILGDCLQVMASLAEREDLRGKVQCIYIDPPYGIKFNSNFQWSTTSRDVRDGKPEHITREPEQVKAFRDTWRDGIHSYLTYLRDRLTAARDLLTESGSIFVQIGEENVHRVRALMDEVFGETAFVASVAYAKTTGFSGTHMSSVCDYLLWYSRDLAQMKFRSLFLQKQDTKGIRRYRPVSTIGALACSSDHSEQAFAYHGAVWLPPPGLHWKTTVPGLRRLEQAERVFHEGRSLRYLRFLDDFSVVPRTNVWQDVGGVQSRTDPKIFVVQTATEAVKRCILMTTDPGDLVLDPTCGSGTTAYVAEQWGRRWITIDTSRVALALARGRVMGARYPYYLLADSKEGLEKEAQLVQTQPDEDTATYGDIRQGFVYERVPHITLKSIANNAEVDEIWEAHQPALEQLRARLNEARREKWEEWEVPRHAEEPWEKQASTLFARLKKEQNKKKPNTSGVRRLLDELNAVLGRSYTLESLPERPADPWPEEEHQALHAEWWKGRIARLQEIDASIAAKANYEYLYDKPYEDKRRVRVSGPFTVESLSPHRELSVDENDDLVDEVAEPKPGYGREQDFASVVLDNLRTAGVQQARKEDKIAFSSLTAWPGDLVCAEGRFVKEGSRSRTEQRAAIFVGPEFGTVARPDLVVAAREAAEAGFDILVACAFNYGPHATEFNKLGRIPVLKARMNAELHMAEDLENTGKGNLFVVFGEPDIEILLADDGDPDDDRIRVKIHGVDVFHPASGEVRSDGPDGIACWFIDTNYDEESFFVRHAYFCQGYQRDPYKALKMTLKAEINPEAWATLKSDMSRPFDRPKSGRIAVKVINHLGDEVMKVFRA